MKKLIIIVFMISCRPFVPEIIGEVEVSCPHMKTKTYKLSHGYRARDEQGNLVIIPDTCMKTYKVFKEEN